MCYELVRMLGLEYAELQWNGQIFAPECGIPVSVTIVGVD